MSDIDILELKADIINDNDEKAAEIRERLKREHTFFVNIMGSPGAGKTTMLIETIKSLKESGDCKIGVIEADVDCDTDSRAVYELGVEVVQVHTGGSCHMDASMTQKALDRLGSAGFDVIFLENVGNLVCPAEFDIGASLSVMLLSLPEGDDKPLKYPLMFTVSDIILISKCDTKPVFDFDETAFRRNVAGLKNDAKIIPLSFKNGENTGEWFGLITRILKEKGF
ncbi:MAG: hydrogenase nickel incorporation protein HypB [Lachnospiraceae bacterium]|nr:hydrogenase nickel incorporation protein HypB [Lachnospiraceae bacterium]